MSKRAGVRRFGATFVVAVVMVSAALFAGTARASSTIPVHNTADLVAAVASGSSGDTILLDAGVQYSPNAPLEVGRNITIETDPSQLALGGKAGIISGGSMQSASPSNGLDPGEKDVLIVGSGNTLTLSNVVVTQASSQGNGGVVVLGGATALIDHSLLSGNSSNAIDLFASGQATVTDSTIANSILGLDGILTKGALTLNEDTIANNSGDGIDKSGGTASVTNTILANNGTNCNTSTGLTGSNSGDTDGSCGTTITTNGFRNVSAGLGPLASTGGPTSTYALTVTSPAINHGTGSDTTDQRGFPRDSSPDIGAYELPPTLMVIKHVVGPASPSQWNISVTGNNGTTVTPGSFAGVDTPGKQVTVTGGDGTYTIAESGGPAGYNLTTSGSCSGPLSPGTQNPATCTLTNTANPTDLTVTTLVNGPSGAASPSAFTMTVTDTDTHTVLNQVSGPTGPFAGSSSGVHVNVPAGDHYTVTETAGPTAHYTESDSAGCAGQATVGGTASCTATNSAKPTAVLVQKFVVGPDPPSAFQMTVTDTSTSPNPTVLASFAGSNAGTPVNVPAGDNYTVTESGAQLSNYTASPSTDCSGTATIDGSVTCAITNTINCAQPNQTPGQGSSNTCVQANVATTIVVSSPAVVVFGPLGVGETSGPVSVPVNVKSNDGLGYQLSAIRTKFSNPLNSTDIPLSIGVVPPDTVSSPMVLDLGGLTPIPTSGPNLNLGEVHNAITTAAGDTWPFSMVLGAIPWNIAAGPHQSVVTFTAVGF